jgi:hypothetical protein
VQRGQEISRQDRPLAPPGTTRLPHPSEQDYADAHRPSEEEQHNTLYVKGLPFDCTEERLKAAMESTFASFETLAVALIRSEDGDPTGTAYVVLSGMPFDGFATGTELKRDDEGAPWKGVIARKSLRRLYTEAELNAELEEYMQSDRRAHERLLDAEVEAYAERHADDEEEAAAEGRLERAVEAEAEAVATEVEDDREGGYDEGAAEEEYENRLLAARARPAAKTAKPKATKPKAAKTLKPKQRAAK